MGGRGSSSLHVNGGLGRDPMFGNFLTFSTQQDAIDYHLLHNWDRDKWSNQLTHEEQQGIYDYTSHWYGRINAALRLKQQADPRVQAMIDGAKSGLSKWTAAENMVVYRGANKGWTANLLEGTEDQLSNQAFLRSRIGKTFTDEGFMSSGTHQDSAWGGAVQYKIYVNKGVSGMYVDEISANSGEYEFLFNSGTRFKVHQITTDSGGMIKEMVLEALPVRKKK